MIYATRCHDFSYGHRVVGHEGKCKHLHGHNARVHFTCKSEAGNLDSVGRVIDFSVIKQKLCTYLESEWDHKMLIWSNDPWLDHLLFLPESNQSFVVVSYNPTAENMAHFLLHTAGPILLADTGVELCRVVFEETRKCSVTVEL